MHISIAGQLGSGKSTVCQLLKARHGYQIYSTGEIQRALARKENISTLEMNKAITEAQDNDIDAATTRISIEKSQAGEVVIFDSRMAWKFAQNSYRVFVTVDPQEAARRVMSHARGQEETYATQQEACEKLIQRAQLENDRFKKIYNVDNLDPNNYDLVIDSTNLTPDQLADTIYEKYCLAIQAN